MNSKTSGLNCNSQDIVSLSIKEGDANAPKFRALKRELERQRQERNLWGYRNAIININDDTDLLTILTAEDESKPKLNTDEKQLIEDLKSKNKYEQNYCNICLEKLYEILLNEVFLKIINFVKFLRNK